MPGKLLSSEEIRLAKMWYEDDDMTPGEIAELLRRNKSTMTRLLVKQDERTGRGQPKSLCSGQVDRMVSVCCIACLLRLTEGMKLRQPCCAAKLV